MKKLASLLTVAAMALWMVGCGGADTSAPVDSTPSSEAGDDMGTTPAGDEMTDEPTTDEPAGDEPTTDEPTTDEPTGEETTPE